MKLIRAVVRPERERHVEEALVKVDQVAVTKISVSDRARHGAASAFLNQAELLKVMFWIVACDERVEAIVTAIHNAAYTGIPGDGRIVVSPVEQVIHLRTGELET